MYIPEKDPKRPKVLEYPQHVYDQLLMTEAFKGKSLKEVALLIDNLIEKYDEGDRFSYVYEGHDGAFEIYLNAGRYETGQEVANRVEKEKKIQARYDKKQEEKYELYLKLKEQFEGTQ